MTKVILAFKFERLVIYAVFLILILIPFHAFFTTWLGAVIGNRVLWQAWKEILLVAASVFSLALLIKDRGLAKKLLGFLPNKLILAYSALHLIWGFLPETDFTIWMLALKYNLSFLLIFLVVQIVVHVYKPKKLADTLSKLVLIPAAIVGLFAILQAVVLPLDFLTNFGYGAKTIQPFWEIPGSGQIRVISTLGGPNQLGTYLVLPIALTAYIFVIKRKWVLIPLFAILLSAEYFSYSRTGWLATATALAVVGLLNVPRKYVNKLVIGGLIIIGILAVIVLPQLKNSLFLQGIVYHSRQEVAFTESSTKDHLKAIKKGTQTALANPLGLGPGAAGPVTKYKQKLLIPENYYLQIAIEVGLVGLVLFLGIFVALVKKLLSSANKFVCFVVATGIGLGLAGLFTHVWTDSTTALMWWAIAGLVVTANKNT